MKSIGTDYFLDTPALAISRTISALKELLWIFHLKIQKRDLKGVNECGSIIESTTSNFKFK